jgi:hypothetical protein
MKKKNNYSLDIFLPKITPSKTITEASSNINDSKHPVYKSYIKLNKYQPKIKNKANSTKKEIYKALNIIHKLDIEKKVQEIYNEEILMERKREKVNNNKEIREKRLSIFVKKENNSKLEEEEEKTHEAKIKKINEKILEKYGMREREKKMEKKYNYNLKELEKAEKELEEKNNIIKDLVYKIENSKLEINVIGQYGANIDRKQINSEQPIRVLEKKKSSRIETLFKKRDFKAQRRSSLVEDINVEKESKSIIKKYQRDEKQRKIRSTVDIDLVKLEYFQKEFEQLNEKILNIKNEIFNSKKELVNIYHITLYEGLDFRNYGLCTYILNIWKLEMNVDINFFPTYLDKISVNFLFDKARKILYTSKLKKLIEDTNLDIANSFGQWKEEENILSKSQDNNIFDFFKTKILQNGNDLFYEQYPKSKLFMMNYNKNHENESNKVGNIKVNNISFKNINIPGVITDKNNKKEDLKYLLKMHLKQMEIDERNEVLRITKEFLYNDYEKKHQVCIETIIGALCGEQNKDEQLNFFYKFKKEYNDNLKKIEFFNKIGKKFSI